MRADSEHSPVYYPDLSLLNDQPVQHAEGQMLSLANLGCASGFSNKATVSVPLETLLGLINQSKPAMKDACM